MPPKPRQRRGLAFTLSPGQAHDAPEGRNLLKSMAKPVGTPALVVDRAPTRTTAPANWCPTSASFQSSRPGATA